PLRHPEPSMPGQAILALIPDELAPFGLQVSQLPDRDRVNPRHERSDPAEDRGLLGLIEALPNRIQSLTSQLAEDHVGPAIRALDQRVARPPVALVSSRPARAQATMFKGAQGSPRFQTSE